MASLFFLSRLTQKSKSQMEAVLQELSGECFPSFAASPFLVALLLSLPVAIAPIWIVPRPRFPSLQEGAPCLSFSLPFFWFCPPSTPTTFIRPAGPSRCVLLTFAYTPLWEM